MVAAYDASGLFIPFCAVELDLVNCQSIEIFFFINVIKTIDKGQLFVVQSGLFGVLSEVILEESLGVLDATQLNCLLLPKSVEIFVSIDQRIYHLTQLKRPLSISY